MASGANLDVQGGANLYTPTRPSPAALSFAGTTSSYSSSLSGTGSVYIETTTGFVLGGDNSSFSGFIGANQGTITLGNANALGNATINLDDPDLTGRTNLSVSGTLDVNMYSIVIAQLLGSGTITDDNTTPGVTNLIVEGGSFYDGHIADGPDRQLALDKIGPNNLILVNSSDYTGGTSIAAGGRLEMDTGGIIAGNVVDDGRLDFAQNGTTALVFADNISGTGWISHDGTAPLTISGNISGGISITQYGSGAMTLSGNNSYTGGTGILATLVAGSSTALGASTGIVSIFPGDELDLAGQSVTIGGFDGNWNYGTITNTSATPGMLTVSDTSNTTFRGTLADGTSGTVALAKSGSGTLTLNDTNDFNGGLYVNAGTVSFQTTITGNITVAAGASITGPDAPPLAVISDVPTAPVLAGTSVSLTGGVTPTSSGTTYSWDVTDPSGNSSDPPDSGLTFTPGSAGMYTVALKATNGLASTTTYLALEVLPEESACDCTCTVDQSTGAFVNAAGQNGDDPTPVPGGGDLTDATANGQNFQFDQPETLTVYNYAGEVAIESPEGRNQIFLGTTTFTPVDAVTDGQLVIGTYNSYSAFIQTDPSGTQWVFADGAPGYTQGQLEAMIPLSGGTENYQYSNGLVAKTVTDMGGGYTTVATYHLYSSGKIASEVVTRNHGSSVPLIVGKLLRICPYNVSGDLESIQSYDGDITQGLEPHRH